jgi:hypothetical protein
VEVEEARRGAVYQNSNSSRAKGVVQKLVV